MDEMNQSPSSDLKGLSEPNEREILRHFGRHLVGLHWLEGWTSADGEYLGDPEFGYASGFVAEIADAYWIVTAGHVFTKYLEKIGKPRFKVSDVNITDCYSDTAKVMIPIPFDFFDPSVPKAIFDDGKLGIDVALISIPYLIAKALIQTITPFTSDKWKTDHTAPFDYCGMIGFPESDPGQHKVENGVRMTISSSLVFVDPLTWPTEGFDATTWPQFAGQMKHDNTGSVRGMSGGPIFGFRRLPSDELAYFPIAIQSRWRSDRRIVVGTPMAIAFNAIESYFEHPDVHGGSTNG